MNDNSGRSRLGGNAFANRSAQQVPAPNSTVDVAKQAEVELRFNNEKMLKQAFSSFLGVFNKKLLVKFKSQKDLEDEKSVIAALHSASGNVQSRDVDILMFRLLFALRDRINELEAENTQLAKELLRLRSRVDQDPSTPSTTGSSETKNG